ncbi:carotenoid oxygenase family protein [Streptomyces sp. NPDC046909]|uniref:carotenoid oxygenase family protein n=1 Tax=Streptomyces sp. NPDC046909 TaxID=3155617 RepID=UPI0033D61192
MTTTPDRATGAPVRFPESIIYRGYFAPSRIEADVYDLEVEGEIPPDLDGAFLRNAADAQYPPNHPFDVFLNGDGMVTKIRIKDGHADLRTRFVRTERFLAERKARRGLVGAYRNWYTDDPSVPDLDLANNANTAVVWHAGKLLALKEAGLPYELDPHTLETKGIYDFNGQITGKTFTAHPKIDPRTGQMIAFSYFPSRKPDNDIMLFEMDAKGAVTRTERFVAPYASAVHDWIVTRDHLIFTFAPFIADGERLKTEPQYFMWDPRERSHIAVIPRDEGVAGMKWFSTDLLMETHTVNGWSEGDIITLEHFVTKTGWLSQFPKLATGEEMPEAPPILQRWVLDMKQGSDSPVMEGGNQYTSTQLWDFPGDFPRVDPRALMEKHRHTWLGTFNPTLGPLPEFGPMGPPFNSIVHLDAETGVRTSYYPGENAAPEESVFVPKSEDADEGEGYLVALVERREESRTDFVILDALDIGAGPIATVKIPFRLRYGFHGTWIPGNELEPS